MSGTETVQLTCISTGTDWTARLVQGPPGLRLLAFHGNKLLVKVGYEGMSTTVTYRMSV